MFKEGEQIAKELHLKVKEFISKCQSTPKKFRFAQKTFEPMAKTTKIIWHIVTGIVGVAGIGIAIYGWASNNSGAEGAGLVIAGAGYIMEKGCFNL